MRRTFLAAVTYFVLFSGTFQAWAEGGSTPASPGTAPLQVLFIGNSYTYVNNLPAMLSTMADSRESPRSVRTKMVVAPAATLQLLWEKGEAVNAIRETKWDFVVLQEQSVLPTVEPERMRTYARKFDDVIRGSGARTILFLTWARRGKPAMQPELDSAYLNLARDLKSLVAPVGPAWQIALATEPSIHLYMEDGSHPTTLGTYLAACTFFRVILENTTTCPMPMRGVVSSDEAAVVSVSASRALAQMR